MSQSVLNMAEEEKIAVVVLSDDDGASSNMSAAPKGVEESKSVAFDLPESKPVESEPRDRSDSLDSVASDEGIIPYEADEREVINKHSSYARAIQSVC